MPDTPTLRIAVVTTIPTPYRDPFWEVFSQQPGIELTVIYCARLKSDRPWQDESETFTYQRLFPVGCNIVGSIRWGSSCYWNPSIRHILRKLGPDILLVGGYNHFTMLDAVRFARRAGVPWLLMSESWKQRAGLLGKLKLLWVRNWLSSAAGGLPTGKRASRQMCRLGIPLERQSFLPNVPDVEAIHQRAESLQASRDELRKQLGISSRHLLFVYAARMIEKKRPLLVLEAFSQLDFVDSTLVMIGDGPFRQKAEQLASQFRCPGRVKFPGFIAPLEVHRWMAAADVFVHPSSETWGVAPIEAIASGVPVILSSEVGCQEDVITDERVGRVVVPGSVESLRDAMARYSELSGNRGPVFSLWQHWCERNRYSVLAERLQGMLSNIMVPPHIRVVPEGAIQ